LKPSILFKNVHKSQPLNAGKGVKDYSMFSFSFLYGIWEQYDVILKEIAILFALGLVSVFVVSLIFLPNVLAAIFVTIVVAIVDVELLAILYADGITVHALSMVGLTMSVGLVVDYNLHVVVSFFENEDIKDGNARVEKVLKTMGKSVFLGGFSTFLGAVPLSLSKSDIFSIFFVNLMGVVLLGIGHGLIFIPVVLSFFAGCKNADESNVNDGIVEQKNKDKSGGQDNFIAQ